MIRRTPLMSVFHPLRTLGCFAIRPKMWPARSALIVSTILWAALAVMVRTCCTSHLSRACLAIRTSPSETTIVRCPGRCSGAQASHGHSAEDRSTSSVRNHRSSAPVDFEMAGAAKTWLRKTGCFRAAEDWQSQRLPAAAWSYEA